MSWVGSTRGRADPTCSLASGVMAAASCAAAGVADTWWPRAMCQLWAQKTTFLFHLRCLRNISAQKPEVFEEK